MPLYIYRSLFRDKKPGLPSVLNNGYGDSSVKIKGHAQMYSSLEVRHHRKCCYSTTDRLYTLPKDNSTKAYTTTQDTCSPESHNSKGTRTERDKQDGSRSETPKYLAT